MPQFAIIYKLVNNDHGMYEIINDIDIEYIDIENYERAKNYADYNLFFKQIDTYRYYIECNYDIDDNQIDNIECLKEKLDILYTTNYLDLSKLISENFECFQNYLKLLKNMDSIEKEMIESGDDDYSIWEYNIEENINYVQISNIDINLLIKSMN